MSDSCNLWTVAHSWAFLGFPGQEDWSGLLFPSPGNLPNPEIETVVSWIASGFFTDEPSGKQRDGGEFD